ncbi:hypothetical protein ACHAWC_003666 [Mediolabrus comicus]
MDRSSRNGGRGGQRGGGGNGGGQRRRGNTIPVLDPDQAEILSLDELNRRNPASLANLSDMNPLDILNRMRRDPGVRGDDVTGNNRSIILPIRMALLALQRPQDWYTFRNHGGRWELMIGQSVDDGYTNGRFSDLLHVLEYNDTDNNDNETPLTRRAVNHLRSFVCPITNERVCVGPMAMTVEQQMGGTDWNAVNIYISHSNITPDTIVNRDWDRHLIARSDGDRRDHYIRNSGITLIDPCIMPGCDQPRLIGPGCAGRCANHIGRCVGYPERGSCDLPATVMGDGSRRPRTCSGCGRVQRGRTRYP